MNTILRQVFTAVLFSIMISITMVGITLALFLGDDWSSVLAYKIGEIPFLLVVIIVPLSAGLIVGIVTGVYWRQRLHRIEKQMDEIIKGQKLTTDDETYKELDNIQNYLEQIQEKIRLQTENAQRLATERANEREKSLQEIVVQERNRLARELHDSVSQQLFAASMMMSAINESNPPKDAGMKKQLLMVEKMIHQSQLEMRALLLHLRPVALKGKSLQEGVQELLVELTQKVPMDIDWKVEPFTVDKGVEDQLFRILQESVSNTLRHADATSFHVMLIERDDTVILRTVDNGIGFDIEKVKTGSYGMQNMRERAYEVGGVFKVISLPNEGTRLEVKVPNLKKEDEAID
ncbi:two-component sensor histidine kinase [Virgibacillus profundi]|uniref:Sensor histidine kinase n=1 Tax=Virgibacillus profundi TaxID=2024555 RepID=A0A2A2IAN8_9BACI|nr:sensor histidine kinase [Virgibacillus profundi]PAV28642.1 two-component sensor histidine kinase [Virgibacillus profundi]PXY52810.1 sensor histidine kinase [Virgibacillus profundi]